MTEFRNQVKEGNFEKAYELAKEMNLDLIAEELLNLGEENCNMLAYGYIVFGFMKKLLSKKNLLLKELGIFYQVFCIL